MCLSSLQHHHPTFSSPPCSRFLWRDGFSVALPRSQTTDDVFTAASLLEEREEQDAAGSKGGRYQGAAGGKDRRYQLVKEQVESYTRAGLKRFILDKRFPVVSGELQQRCESHNAA